MYSLLYSCGLVPLFFRFSGPDDKNCSKPFRICTDRRWVCRSLLRYPCIIEAAMSPFSLSIWNPLPAILAHPERIDFVLEGKVVQKVTFGENYSSGSVVLDFTSSWAVSVRQFFFPGVFLSFKLWDALVLSPLLLSYFSLSLPLLSSLFHSPLLFCPFPLLSHSPSSLALSPPLFPLLSSSSSSLPASFFLLPLAPFCIHVDEEIHRQVVALLRKQECKS